MNEHFACERGEVYKLVESPVVIHHDRVVFLVELEDQPPSIPTDKTEGGKDEELSLLSRPVLDTMITFPDTVLDVPTHPEPPNTIIGSVSTLRHSLMSIVVNYLKHLRLHVSWYDDSRVTQ